MLRVAAVFLGTAALLGVLVTPASAAAPGAAVDSLVATVGNAVNGLQDTVTNLNLTGS
ncbi:hypothetical protein AB0N17_43455 [Streptomyces sp. NPDC051133]|uniref:hypothetical protein n=1 Tax=Streptomyces sp. NPDC051133 TaxID=3155521 RepID=UPI003423E762